MDEIELEKLIQEKETTIKNLQKETKYWREKYRNVLDAYFELHSYCNKYDDKSLINIENLQQ